MIRRSPAARSLLERFCPNTGLPLRVGAVWPPRPMIHHVATKDDQGDAEVSVALWVRHLLHEAVEVTVRPLDDAPLDSDGRTVSGLDVGRARALVGAARPKGALAPGEEPTPWRSLSLPVRWTGRLAQEIQRVRWIRQGLQVEFADGRSRRVWLWWLYLTPHAAEVPGRSDLDELPHFRWVDEADGELAIPGIARSWIELPAPLSSPTLPPGSWVQPRFVDQAMDDEPFVRGSGPAEIELVSVYPVEPPLPAGVEPVGWNGALGGLDPRPSIQALAVAGKASRGGWSASLRYWDTPIDDTSRPVRLERPTELEPPTSCVWPALLSDDEHPLVLFDLRNPPEVAGGAEVEVKVNFRVVLADDAESVSLERGVLKLGSDVVGRWEEGPLELGAGGAANLRCTLDLARLHGAADGRLKLTLQLQGRPTRGVVRDRPQFRTANGPYVRLQRSRSEGGGRTPWLVIDLGSEGTCAAVAFLDGFVPRVVTVRFDDGPIWPSRVYLSPTLGGVYTLADEPADDSLYTTLIKLGLRFGDGAHPGCPDHVAATEVARFFLKRFLLEVRERMAWFPLSDADVLVSFPPRLAAMPRFVRALHDTFASVLEEVVWADGAPRGLYFREEALLVATPCLYKDLQLSPVAPGRSRYYWVMDFGGGTTDVCGFLVTAAEDEAEEHVVGRLTYPQRLPHHLSGNDVTRAFYSVLALHLAGLGLLARPDGTAEVGRRFPLPPDPFPTVRSSPTALQNQTALRELADALKCLDPTEHGATALWSLARGLRPAPMRTADGVQATMLGLLTGEAASLGELTVRDLHAEVLDPASRADLGGIPTDPLGRFEVRCASCGAPNALPGWVFASGRAFRLRCVRCGHVDRVHLEHAVRVSPARPTPASEPEPEPLDGDARLPDEGELYVEQDGRTYVVRDLDTVRRWVEERRVGPDDRVSTDGLTWTVLREHPQLEDVLSKVDAVGVDITQEVPRGRWERWMFPEAGPGAASAPPAGPPQLGRDIRLFLDGCREALQRAVDALPDPQTEVVVLVAGRASLFGPIAEGVRAFLPGRVVHLTNDWVRKSFGNAGQIDPTADLKSMTVNGGGLFALLHANPETSHLVLRVDTLRMEVPVYLQSAVGARPWLITRQLDLRPGGALPLVAGREDELGEGAEETVDEPLPRPLPPDTPLTGDLQLVVDGLPEDRAWEPYVVIAQGTARRKHGRRARTQPETMLRTEDREFVLGPLSQELEVRFARMLPRLPLLGGEGADFDPVDQPVAGPVNDERG